MKCSLLMIGIFMGVMMLCVRCEKDLPRGIGLNGCQIEFGFESDTIKVPIKDDYCWIYEYMSFVQGDTLINDTLFVRKGFSCDGDWFCVEHCGNSFNVSVKENDSFENRSVWVSVESGNFFDGFMILQKGKEE